MTALRTALAFNGTMPAYTLQASVARKAPVLLKNMALFLASPFIGLAYALLLPFVGLGLLLWVATQGLRKPQRPAGGCITPVARAAEAAVEPESVVIATGEGN